MSLFEKYYPPILSGLISGERGCLAEEWSGIKSGKDHRLHHESYWRLTLLNKRENLWIKIELAGKPRRCMWSDQRIGPEKLT